MKIKPFGILSIIILLFIAIMITWALFNDNQLKNGIITTGAIKISIFENDKRGQSLEKNQKKIIPGDKIDWVVTVKNLGNKDAWIRVKVAKNLVETTVLDEEPKMLEINIEAGWLEGADGYYYYQTVLPAGAETKPLFKQVGLNILAGKKISAKKVSVDVYGEAVQADNNGKVVSEAAGWPVAN